VRAGRPEHARAARAAVFVQPLVGGVGVLGLHRDLHRHDAVLAPDDDDVVRPTTMKGYQGRAHSDKGYSVEYPLFLAKNYIYMYILYI
jgi:hypothetical protein